MPGGKKLNIELYDESLNNMNITPEKIGAFCGIIIGKMVVLALLYFGIRYLTDKQIASYFILGVFLIEYYKMEMRNHE